MTDKLSFVPFESQYAKDFKALNIEWLQTFFVVEPYDDLVLSNPVEQIIAPGGAIFMLQLNKIIIGTFAFIKKENGVYEFSKMAVRPSERGKGYGNKIVQFVIHYAKQQHCASSTKKKKKLAQVVQSLHRTILLNLQVSVLWYGITI